MNNHSPQRSGGAEQHEVERLKLRETARRMASDEGILCLHAIDQPLVSEMQQVIRFQQAELKRTAGAIRYFFKRIRKERALQDHMIATEALAQLCQALAGCEGREPQDVHAEFQFPWFGKDDEEGAGR